jgi:hypothetical protein
VKVVIYDLFPPPSILLGVFYSVEIEDWVWRSCLYVCACELVSTPEQIRHRELPLKIVEFEVLTEVVEYNAV